MAFLLLFLPIAYAKSTLEQDVAKVVKIIIYDTETKEYVASGSGARINPNGDILTNFHVIQLALDRAMIPIVCFIENEKSIPQCDFSAEIIGHNSNIDLALLKIKDHLGTASRPETRPVLSRKKTPINDYLSEKGIEHLPFFSFSRSNFEELPELGEQVQILGFPGASSDFLTYSKGEVSGFEQVETTSGEMATLYIRTDALLRPGNSGGAAINQNGELIGVPSAFNTEDENTNYIISMPFVLSFLSEVNESNNEYYDASLDKFECNPGMQFIPRPGKNKQGICEFAIKIDCGINAQSYSNTAENDDCICKKNFTWELTQVEKPYCVADLGKLFPVYEHTQFGKNVAEKLGAQIEIRSGVEETADGVLAKFDFEIVADQYKDFISHYSIIEFANDKFYDRSKGNILSVKQVDIDVSDYSMSIKPNSNYYLEIIGKNKKNHDLMVLRISFAAGDSMEEYSLLEQNVKQGSITSDDSLTYQELTKRKRQQFIDMIIETKQKCDDEFSVLLESKACFKESFKQQFLKYIEKKREGKKKCANEYEILEDRKYCELEYLTADEEN